MKWKPIGWILVTLGLIIVFGTHIALIAMPLMELGIAHATLNLSAGVGILIGTLLISKRGRK